MKSVKMLKVLIIVVLLTTYLGTGVANAVSVPTTLYYGDFIIDGNSYWLHGSWDLTAGPVTVSYELDLTDAPNNACNNWGGCPGISHWSAANVGLVNVGPAPGYAWAGAWMSGFLSDWDNSSTMFPTFPDIPGGQDLDDKLNMARSPNPDSYDERHYNVDCSDKSVEPEVGSDAWSNYGVWFDRDGVDPWQANMWGMVDGGTYNTNGVYQVQVEYEKASSDPTSKGTACAKLFPSLGNPDAPDGYGIPTGFKSTGSGYQYFPYGISFDSSESKMGKMQAFVSGSVYPGSTIIVRDLTVTGYLNLEEGMVTGGGWINSPAGAFKPTDYDIPTFVWDQGFESDADGWFEYGGSITRVESGTNGVASATGSWHAEVTVGPSNENGAYTRFGGYSSSFPAGGFSQLVDVYIDPAMGDIGQGWALDNALNGSDGIWEEAGGVGALKANDGNWWLAADGDGGGYPGTINGGVGLRIDTPGWYTIESQWVENADDPSRIDRNTFIYDSDGALLYSVYHLTQVALADAGGNRYGWFLDPNGPDWPPIQFPLPIDNSRLLQLVSPTGKATFGFVSKYKKGADTPTGNTEFVFKAADLNFHSSSYDWLVVTGSDYARFKGSGTINGEGDYRFMLWAGDGDPDTFRIKIWWEEDDTEHVIYDNGMDQPIGGGNIVIHTKKK